MDIQEFDLTAVQMFENSNKALNNYYDKEKKLLEVFEMVISEAIMKDLHETIKKNSDNGRFKARVKWTYVGAVSLLWNNGKLNKDLRKYFDAHEAELSLKIFDRFIEVCDKVHERLIINGFKVNRKVVDSKGFRSITFSIRWNLEERGDSVNVGCDYTKLDYDYINGK